MVQSDSEQPAAGVIAAIQLVKLHTADIEVIYTETPLLAQSW